MNHELLKALCIVAKANGCKWVAQDVDGWVLGFENKPMKNLNNWFRQKEKDDCFMLSGVGYCDNWQESLVNIDEYLESER